MCPIFSASIRASYGRCWVHPHLLQHSQQSACLSFKSYHCFGTPFRTHVLKGPRHSRHSHCRGLRVDAFGASSARLHSSFGFDERPIVNNIELSLQKFNTSELFRSSTLRQNRSRSSAICSNQRRHWSEHVASFSSSSIARSCEAPSYLCSLSKATKDTCAQESRPRVPEATNDAHVHVKCLLNLRCKDLPHDEPDESQKLVLPDRGFLKFVTHQTQLKWELPWHYSIVVVCRKIAQYFPILGLRESATTSSRSIAKLTLNIPSLSKEYHATLQGEKILSREAHFKLEEEEKQTLKVQRTISGGYQDKGYCFDFEPSSTTVPRFYACRESQNILEGGMTHEESQAKSSTTIPAGGAAHRPLVVGLTKPSSTRSASTMASSAEAAALNKEIAENVKENTTEAAPAAEIPTEPPAQKPKKEKAPKQPKPQKAAAPTAPTSPALIDLRVGHILRAIAHPNADSLYVSTIAMGDPEGTEHTQIDEETGKIVRTVCSGLNGLIPLEEMQNRKIIVVANLKPVNMRSIKSAAMVLAASPKQPEGADPHAPDRVVELVQPPENAEAGDKVYFDGWPYGEGKGPEKQLNPKKKQWEAIQPGFYTSNDLTVGFDASQCEEVEGGEKGNLVVEGKGACTVKTLKGAVVR